MASEEWEGCSCQGLISSEWRSKFPALTYRGFRHYGIRQWWREVLVSEEMIFDRCMDVTGLGIGPCCVGRDAGHLKVKGKPCRPYQEQSLPAAVQSCCRRQERDSFGKIFLFLQPTSLLSSFLSNELLLFLLPITVRVVRGRCIGPLKNASTF